MKPALKVGAAMLAAGTVLMAGAAGTARPGPDNEATANTLVTQCANVKQGDLVLITGTPSDAPLIESVAVQVRKLGAFPLISVGSERLARRFYDEVPARFDGQTDQFDLKLASIITARISIDASENPALFADASPERLAAFSKAEKPIAEALLKRNVRQVSLGNGLYPTAATAKLHGLSQEALSTLFWQGVNTDYSSLQDTGEAIQRALASGKEVRITNPNGTDLKFGIQGRTAFASDGVISTDDIAKGGAACQVWLPAGEVYGTPTPGTAAGKVVIDRYLFQGKEITGLTLTFKAGKLTDFTAQAGLEPLRAAYAASDTGRDAFAFFDIGINPAIKIPQSSKLLAWMPAGMVTIGVGENTWAGGTNTSNFELSGFLPNSTLTVDGKPLVQNGQLKLTP
ncbi:MAG: aminopeptidase [Phycisphaerales bacterium]